MVEYIGIEQFIVTSLHNNEHTNLFDESHRIRANPIFFWQVIICQYKLIGQYVCAVCVCSEETPAFI